MDIKTTLCMCVSTNLWVFAAWVTLLYICFEPLHDDVIKWKHFPRNWPFVREIHRSPVNFPHKGQWRGALMFSLIYAWINDWVNNREAGDLRRQHGHYDVIVMISTHLIGLSFFESRHQLHYNDVIVNVMASQITSLTIVHLTVYSGADQRQHQSSTLLVFVMGIHRWPVNSPHKGLLTQKMFPFDAVIM